MVLENMDVISVILAAAIAGIGSGVGVALGNALYKALLESKVNAFLDKKHRQETLKRLKEIAPEKSIIFSNGKSTESVVEKMIGKRVDYEVGKEQGITSNAYNAPYQR
jgi:hypothetical protein